MQHVALIGICCGFIFLTWKHFPLLTHFINQFKKIFAASAIPTCMTLSTGKISLLLKLHNKWGHSSLGDLTDLVNLFGIPGNHMSQCATTIIC